MPETPSIGKQTPHFDEHSPNDNLEILNDMPSLKRSSTFQLKKIARQITERQPAQQ